MQPKYVLFNLDYNSYLAAGDDLYFFLVKDFKEALTFSSKEDAVKILHNEKVQELAHYWTTREYFSNS